MGIRKRNKLNLIYIFLFLFITVQAPDIKIAYAAYPIVSCGLDGTVQERMAHCTQTLPEICEGAIDEIRSIKPRCSSIHIHNAKQVHSWRLISRTNEGIEVWRDEESELVWTDRLDRQLPWAGAQQACISASSGAFKFASALALRFAVPSEDQFYTADQHAAGAVLPNLARRTFWSQSPLPQQFSIARFDGGYNRFSKDSELNSKSLHSVRCVSLVKTPPQSEPQLRDPPPTNINNSSQKPGSSGAF